METSPIEWFSNVFGCEFLRVFCCSRSKTGKSSKRDSQRNSKWEKRSNHGLAIPELELGKNRWLDLIEDSMFTFSIKKRSPKLNFSTS